VDVFGWAKLIDRLWNEVDSPAVRSGLREVSLRVLGHAPDPVQTWSELVDTMGVVTPRVDRGNTGMWLSCGMCLPVTIEAVGDTGICDSERRRILARILKGHSTRREEKCLRDSMIFQSETLRVRTRLVPRLAIKWLRGRKDLLAYLTSLVGVAGMGAGVFCTFVAGLTAHTNHALFDLLEQRQCYSCCIACGLESQKKFKVAVRFGTTDQPHRDGEIFDWQYASHLLGRFDNAVFADQDDLQLRVDYDGTLPVRNGVSFLKEEFDARYEEELRKEGRRFGYICAMARRTSGQEYHHLTEKVLTAVPTGSVPAIGINEAALTEVDKMLLNKKLALVYFTKGEEEACKYAQMHARSGWLWKLEISKLRNLVPGTYGYYLSSARVSMYGEARFLGTMEGVPLMWSEARKEDANKMFMQWQQTGFVACRDYKNYNLCHKHERMQMFYDTAAAECTKFGEIEMAADFEHMSRCLDDVGVYVDEEYKRWEYGLQTGWAHTMLFHCLHNSAAGRVAAEMIRERTGWRRYISSHQGDDSREIWSNAMCGPLAQSILDAGGQVGQPEKQHFARGVDSWAEFLRVWYKRGVTRGSALRLIGGFVSADSQHKPHEGGMAMLQTIITSCNDVWRRLGGELGWRRSDIAAALEYWSTTNATYRETGVVIDWRAILSERFGMALAAYPDMQWVAKGGRLVQRFRYPVAVGPVLLKRARRNLQAVGRVAGLGKYAKEYAEDVLQSSVERSVELENVDVLRDVACGDHSGERLHHRELQRAARQVVDRCLAGRGGWRDKDKFSVQMAVNYLFAGSERVARASVKNGTERYSVRGPDSMRKNVFRGLDILAGRTSVVKAKKNQSFVCAEKYWTHIEVILREYEPLCVVQRWLGHLVAREAIARGEWI
jgi:hypothetical protein